MSTYFMNLTAATITGKGEWELAYNFTTTYNVSNVSGESIYHMAKQLRDNDTDVFTKYYSYFTVLQDTDISHCNDSCRRHHYCSIAAVDQDDFKICVLDLSTTQTDSVITIKTGLSVHKNHFDADVTMLLYIMCTVGVFSVVLMLGVCFYRTQQFHRQYRYMKTSSHA